MVYSKKIVFDFVKHFEGVWILLCSRVCQFRFLRISVTLLVKS